MAGHTLAGKLVLAFGDPDRMAQLYAPDIEWSIPPNPVYPRPMVGYEAVLAFNRAVWTAHYEPDCTVEILDEIGGEGVSAVRFTYRAFAKGPQKIYENEYTLFARARDGRISEVFELMDAAQMSKLYAA